MLRNTFYILYKHKVLIALWIFIAAYIAYFSFFTILRYRTLYASYFDLGIMHQTVYNTYQSIKTLDPSRILELTNPFGPEQIKRMSIHNDILLGLISLFYFIHSGPETLLVLQAIALGLGAFAVWKIVGTIFKNHKNKSLLALIFSIAYLLYPSMQRVNIYEFHAVALSIPFLLYMFYFWLTKRYRISSLFFILSLLSKEEVALTTIFFGVYIIFTKWRENNFFGLTIIFSSTIYLRDPTVCIYFSRV